MKCIKNYCFKCQLFLIRWKFSFTTIPVSCITRIFILNFSTLDFTSIYYLDFYSKFFHLEEN